MKICELVTSGSSFKGHKFETAKSTVTDLIRDYIGVRRLRKSNLSALCGKLLAAPLHS